MTEKNVVTAIRDALHDEMADDDRIVLLGEDVGNRGGVFRISAGWMQEFGEQRVIDTPLAESGSSGSRSAWRCTCCRWRRSIRGLHPSGVRSDRVGSRPHPVPIERPSRVPS